jgi:hypothetical protein
MSQSHLPLFCHLEKITESADISACRRRVYRSPNLRLKGVERIKSVKGFLMQMYKREIYYIKVIRII